MDDEQHRGRLLCRLGFDKDIRVRLTDEGRAHLRLMLEGRLYPPPPVRMDDPNDHGFTIMPFWFFMTIFGEADGCWKLPALLEQGSVFFLETDMAYERDPSVGVILLLAGQSAVQLCANCGSSMFEYNGTPSGDPVENKEYLCARCFTSLTIVPTHRFVGNAVR